MSSAARDEPAPTGLPEPVRRRVVEFTAACLGALPVDDVPAPLRKVARFEPRRRVRFGAAPIAVALESDEAFRELIAERLRAEEPELGSSVDEGKAPGAADPAEVAAAAYLLRPEGWERLVGAASDAAERDLRERRDEAARHRLREQLDAKRAESDRELQTVREQLDAARAEIRMLRSRVHQERGHTHSAERVARDADEAVAHAVRERDAATERVERAEAETRRLRTRLVELEARLEAGRRAERAERSDETVRLAVLVDALVSAAQGVRRELALPTVTQRPADTVAERHAGEPGEHAPHARGEDDPATVDRLLAAPQAHLVVDGYNVTKTGWPELTLEAQRSRLLGGLARLVAQVHAEVTCVFDGADLGGRVPVPSARGVRVLFSPKGVTADDLIADLVRAEPAGRRVVVVSSDREVMRHARRAAAYPLASLALVDRLTRG